MMTPTVCPSTRPARRRAKPRCRAPCAVMQGDAELVVLVKHKARFFDDFVGLCRLRAKDIPPPKRGSGGVAR